MNRAKFVFILLTTNILIMSPVFAWQKIKMVSGDKQTGVAGSVLKKDFVVQVLSENDKPVSGVPVIFSIVNEAGESPSEKLSKEESFLSSPVSITDSQGYASNRLNLGRKSKGNIIITAATRDSLGDPAIFTVASRSKMWILILFLGIVGGLGIFLFGMFYLNDALQKISGPNLRNILIKLTKSPWKGIGTGFFVTLFNQSSSATTFLEVSLVSAGVMTFYQSIAVTMGAEIGSTITAQLIAFKISEFSVILAGVGFYISFFSRNKKWKKIGNAVLGFGILFLGMKIMADSMLPVGQNDAFIEIMKKVENPLIGILIGFVFTIIIHSSGATAGIVIAMAIAGVITLNQAIPINLGAQAGTCITALLSSIGRSREGKRVAIWHVIHQMAGLILVYPFLTVIVYKGEPAWIYFVKQFTQNVFLTSDTARQIAMGHTMLSVFNAVIFLPILPLVNKTLLTIFPSAEKEKAFGPIYIDEGLLENPSLALGQAKKEIVREGKISSEMYAESLKVFETLDVNLSETVSLKDFKVDILRNSIVQYLAKIGQNTVLNEEQSLKETQLLYITADFEAIGDIIDKNIMPLARKKIKNELWFSDEGWKDIVELHSRVLKNFEAVIGALDQNDLENAKIISEAKAEINGFSAELRKRHIDRINAGLKESLETSSVHLDLIDQFKRINSYISDISTTLLGRI
ncbi:MAG: Na/Pi cotransporter family protein [Elusimicrobia bacterium]|nr:Na/Pi cotransporter family protein [Elusimicrobiota bacterium]